jgi:RNA polymerase primary sigma factor
MNNNTERERRLTEKLYDSLGALPENLGQLLRDKYGLDDGRRKTTQELSDKYLLSPGQIEQLLAEGLRELRHSDRT